MQNCITIPLMHLETNVNSHVLSKPVVAPAGWLKTFYKGATMEFYKDANIALAIKSAIRDFGEKNDLDGMDYFAEKLGFKGANRSVQLHNHISHKNIEKDLKLTVLYTILEEMDQEGHEIVLKAFAEKYGFCINPSSQAQKQNPHSIETAVPLSLLNLGSTQGSMEEEVMQAIDDGNIDKSEAKRILKSISEIEKTVRGLRDALIEHIG